MIYLDNAATTPVDPRVAAAMVPYLTERFGNPASTGHRLGREAAEAVDAARRDVAALVRCRPAEIVFTSGATESTNLALKGAAPTRTPHRRRLVALRTEHPATLDALQALARAGFAVTLVDVEPGGRVDPARFAAALDDDTALASVALVNNEIGVVQDVAALGELCRARGVLLHVDAAQATGKVAIDLASWPVDLMSFSAHKTYGPKGIGALYVRRGVAVLPQIDGGGHERGLRSGTLATHQAVGMGEAYRLAALEMDADTARIEALRDRLWAGLRAVGGISLNGDFAKRVPHNVNASFAGVDGERLMLALPGIACSTGAACASASHAPSHVLRALGRSDEAAASSLRLSLGRFTTAHDVDAALAEITRVVARLRAHSPPRDEAPGVDAWRFRDEVRQGNAPERGAVGTMPAASRPAELEERENGRSWQSH